MGFGKVNWGLIGTLVIGLKLFFIIGHLDYWLKGRKFY